MLIAFAIFLFTLVLVIWQPRGLGIGWSATLGALLALALGSVAPGDIPTVWNIVWNATATFIAVIVISLLLDEAGFFEWAALHVARWAVQTRCQAPRRSFVPNPFRDRTAAANNLPERFTTPGRESVNP
ncbi:hypothetical protein G039_0333225 [Pseudomonas aeruginosa VRFPA01]|nr:hypothetical protein G039_0333225 [Pseudomonas aeruginosa VRFPA01]